MLTCQSEQPDVLQAAACCREVRRALESALGLTLNIASHEGRWQRSSDEPGPGLRPLHPEDSDVDEWLSSHGQTEEPLLGRPASQGFCLAIPVQRIVGAPVVLWANIDGHDQDYVRRFAGYVWSHLVQRHEQADLAEQLDVFAEQVTTDFEELCWLRSLTEHLDLCDVQTDTQSVAAAVLPSLRQVIKAENVLLLPLSAPASDVRSQDDRNLSKLVQTLAPQAGDYPTVWNRQPDGAFLADVANVRNCMLVKVGKPAHPVGWLLAVNKVPPTVSRTFNSPSGFDLNDYEFGTREASLFHAAAVMLATHARNVALFREKEKLLVGVIQAMINAIDAKDAYTCGHSDRVARIAKRLAEELRVAPAECERVYLAGLLHDIGKIGVPDDILRKPGGLTDEEFEQIKKHPEIGHSILKHVDQLSDLLPGVLHHHESIDGHGYPHALAGDQIPLLGRILAVADSFDAMTSSRPYRQAMDFAKAEAILRGGAGSQWDAAIVEAFFSALDDIKVICQTP